MSDKALSPEAPADPCASHRSMGFHIDPCCPHCEAPAEGAGEDCITTQSLNDAASDPEWCAKWNREPPEEWSEGPAMTVTLVRHQVSGLLSIQKWDGGDDFEPGAHVLVPLCLAQRAVVRARSSAPEAREEALGNLLAVIHGDGGHRALEVGTKQAALEAEKIVAGLFAAPSADKLRIAVEALDEARENLIQCGDHFGAGQCADAVSLISTPDALKGDAKP